MENRHLILRVNYMGMAIDDRGITKFINEFPIGIKRMYWIRNFHNNFVRAWHGHEHGDQYFVVMRGAAMIVGIPILSCSRQRFSSKDVIKHVGCGQNPQLIYIPKGYANGIKTFSTDTEVLCLSTQSLEEVKNDDIRFNANLFNEIWNIEER